ncbi:putative riboflavin kinase isoform X2 [Episyrphus balteatus]|uniref:putative riboflavin kinase isoform X2 n=1 Tax=Episyrphus balteatus TaxID=286459 RepID=UPI002486743A|nr:putative riboflavin kinase isoform X2 [Episyrphus balteatus]
MTICLGLFNLRLIAVAGVANKLARSADVHSTLIAVRSITTFRRMASLPHYASGEIVPGFGRGSKELGIPTANFPLDVVQALPSDFVTGVYYGWANIDSGEVHKMVMSVGWNPFYENKQKSMETHILHEYNRDLYGCILKVIIVGYLRPEKNFDSLEALVATIKKDINDAEVALDNPEHRYLKDSNFFTETQKESNNNGTSEKV